ncbi:MAG TPA: DUF418 domain-containing protein [Chitinophagaceae bacterium]|jgi:uncharacterized protein|nr:DUF418 domain-containing protein [Chitinophagaceae bacterium]
MGTAPHLLSALHFRGDWDNLPGGSRQYGQLPALWRNLRLFITHCPFPEMQSVSINPVQQGQRAAVLDVLRGFALLGICLANAGYFSLYIFQQKEALALLPTAAADRWFSFFHLAFIEGKFYSLFSLLFGIGFAILFFRKAEESGKGLYFFYRRLFFLLLFGLAHSFLLWDGDILFFYAVIGALLPLFRHRSNRVLLGWSVALLLLPLLFDVLKVASDGAWNISRPFLEQATKLDRKAGITEANISSWLITHDRYSDLLAWCRSGFWWSWQTRLDTNRVPKVLAMFLLGLYAGRTRLYLRVAEEAPLLRRVRAWCLGIGIPAGIAHAYFGQDGRALPAAAGLWDTLTYALNVAPLAIGYACTLALWYTAGAGRRLRWLEPAGRMALTNYIGQTVLGIALYFGIGAGLGARVGPAVYMPVALAVFALQVAFSHLWMRHFDFGPLEWLWRGLTYGKRLPIRKRRRAEAVPAPAP